MAGPAAILKYINYGFRGGVYGQLVPESSALAVSWYQCRMMALSE